MPTLNGVLETALYVDDLERSIRFYKEIFQLGQHRLLVPPLLS